MKDTDFYNAESNAYSKKRYPELATTFTQFFFKERLRLTLLLLKKFLPKHGSVSMLEIGCADGVVARAVWQNHSENVASFDAVDIAPQMIAVAQKNNADTPIHFSVRDTVALPSVYDCIVEVGVLNYLQLADELNAVQAALTPRGTYICSISGLSSLQTTLKGWEGYMHLHPYAYYEQEFAKRFTIVRAMPVGFFVPLLWKVPAVARILQPLIEKIALSLVPNLAHEKIYVLTTKN